MHINILCSDTVLDQTRDESILVEMSKSLVRLNDDDMRGVRLILVQFSFKR
jgi:hypothetical protein